MFCDSYNAFISTFSYNTLPINFLFFYLIIKNMDN